MEKNFVQKFSRLFRRRKQRNTIQLFDLLPVELLDMILRKSYMLFVSKAESNRQTNGDIIVALASVNFFWFQWITSRKFKRSLRRFLTGVRSNASYSLGAKLKIEKKDVFVLGMAKLRNEKKDVFVLGMAKLRNQIHVLCQSYYPPSRWISIFEDENQFRLQKKMKIKDISDPWDIVSSEKENCLYVSDYDWEGKKSCIWKIKESEDGGHQVTKWLTDINANNALTLSLSSDGELLMSTQGEDETWNLLIYGPDAELRLSIPLPREDFYDDIYHAVKTSKGNFIICHHWCEKKEGQEEKRRKYRVNEVTRDGKIFRRFIPKDGNQELDQPCYLSIDSNDRVIVADCQNNRVILLDSDLQWNRILFPTEEEKKKKRWIYWPCRLCYDEGNNQLMVGGGYYGWVNVYSLNF